MNPGSLAIRAIPLTYIGFLIALPMAALIWEAFRGGGGPLLQQLTMPQAVHALVLTFGISLIMALINIVTGTAMAWVLVRYDFPFKGFVNAMIDIPFAIPTVVTGMMLVALYGPNSTLGMFLENCGIEIILAKPGIVLALLFVTFPFVVRAVQPVLMELDLDMEEAAGTLGASRAETFFKVVLPVLIPSILSGAALSFSRALGEFGSIVVVAGNIPMKTQVASVYVYGEIESANMPGALGVSLILLFSSFLILLALNGLQRWGHHYEQ
jgi:sulfate transport system permease protein